MLLESALAELPANANVLCVGVGTGAELAYLAQRKPEWAFTAVEPSGAMLDLCRQLARKEGFAERCVFHQGYLESLGMVGEFDVATSFLVSQFILDERARAAFFREIGSRLRPGGILASSDLAADVQSSEYAVLLRAWMNMMSDADFTPEAIERMQAAYAKDVGILPPRRVASIIQEGGFEAPAQFFQAGLMHGWLSRWP
nr:class I SAM-dependent methyltransferase [Parahaliea mediterranea]